MTIGAARRSHAAPLAVTALVAAIGTGAPARSLAAQSSPSFSSRVAAEIAARWRVSPSAVRLSWIGVSRWDTLGASTPFALLEPGASGTWLVAVGAPARRSPMLELRAGVAAEVPVASRALARGAVLAPSDIRTDTLVLWGAPPSPAGVTAGWVTRRAIPAGQPLRPPAVAPVPLVRAGSQAEVEWHVSSVRITRRGTAATDAALGERVWVRLAVGSRVRGTVTAGARIAADTAQTAGTDR